jgi:hypothetical protein
MWITIWYVLTLTAELDSNTERMKQQWQPPTATKVLFLQIKNGVAFALAGDDPKLEPAILRMAYNNIANTGSFDTTCIEWHREDPALKAWDFFRTEFKSVDKDLRHMDTTCSSGYHGADNTLAHDTYHGSVLRATQAALRASEIALAATLATYVTVTPTASVTTAATNVPTMTPTTTATTPRQRRY